MITQFRVIWKRLVIVLGCCSDEVLSSTISVSDTIVLKALSWYNSLCNNMPLFITLTVVVTPLLQDSQSTFLSLNSTLTKQCEESAQSSLWSTALTINSNTAFEVWCFPRSIKLDLYLKGFFFINEPFQNQIQGGQWRCHVKFPLLHINIVTFWQRVVGCKRSVPTALITLKNPLLCACNQRDTLSVLNDTCLVILTKPREKILKRQNCVSIKYKQVEDIVVFL